MVSHIDNFLHTCYNKNGGFDRKIKAAGKTLRFSYTCKEGVMAEKKEKQYVSDNAQLMAEWDWEKNNELGLDPARTA